MMIVCLLKRSIKVVHIWVNLDTFLILILLLFPHCWLLFLCVTPTVFSQDFR